MADEKPIAWWTEDGNIDINGKAHYPPEEPKPKITRTRPGRF